MCLKEHSIRFSPKKSAFNLCMFFETLRAMRWRCVFGLCIRPLNPDSVSLLAVNCERKPVIICVFNYGNTHILIIVSYGFEADVKSQLETQHTIPCHRCISLGTNYTIMLEPCMEIVVCGDNYVYLSC